MLVTLLIILLLSLLGLVGMYNNLVSLKNHCIEAWSNVDTELKRRYELIPNLVITVKSYAAHEKNLIEKVVKLREKAARNNRSVMARSVDEEAFQRALEQLIMRLEAYPNLRASRHFLELQQELANTENRIQAALRFYNGNVRENNNKIQQFPSTMIAQMFDFRRREFFYLDNLDAQDLPRIKF